jgi:hypothetical protein
MYKMDDDAVNDLALGLKQIVRNARTIMEDPNESHHRLVYIIEMAQKLLGDLKAGKYRTKTSQRMRKLKNT